MTPAAVAKRLAAPIAERAARRLGPCGGLVAPILCYHGVARIAAPENVSSERFHQQIEAVVGQRRVRSLLDLVDEIAATPVGRSPGSWSVALTFDDGYANLLEHALPVLRRLQLPATVFVVPGKLGVTADWPSPAPHTERRLLGHAQLAAVREAGLDIGAHGWSHVDLTACSVQQRADEIGKCYEFLARQLGIARPTFCYPWGRYNAEVVEDVRRAGFAGAVSSSWGVRHRSADLFVLRRLAIDSSDTLRDFHLKLNGGWGWWTRAWWRDLRGD